MTERFYELDGIAYKVSTCSNCKFHRTFESEDEFPFVTGRECHHPMFGSGRTLMQGTCYDYALNAPFCEEGYFPRMCPHREAEE